MADKVGVYSSDTSIYTGSGYLAGIVASVESGSSNAKLTFYDNTSGSGTTIFKAVLTEPMEIFFTDRFAPRFSTGLYVKVESGIIVTVWWRQL